MSMSVTLTAITVVPMPFASILLGAMFVSAILATVAMERLAMVSK